MNSPIVESIIQSVNDRQNEHVFLNHTALSKSEFNKVLSAISLYLVHHPEKKFAIHFSSEQLIWLPELLDKDSFTNFHAIITAIYVHKAADKVYTYKSEQWSDLAETLSELQHKQYLYDYDYAEQSSTQLPIEALSHYVLHNVAWGNPIIYLERMGLDDNDMRQLFENITPYLIEHPEKNFELRVANNLLTVDTLRMIVDNDALNQAVKKVGFDCNYIALTDVEFLRQVLDRINAKISFYYNFNDQDLKLSERFKSAYGSCPENGGLLSNLFNEYQKLISSKKEQNAKLEIFENKATRKFMMFAGATVITLTGFVLAGLIEAVAVTSFLASIIGTVLTISTQSKSNELQYAQIQVLEKEQMLVDEVTLKCMRALKPIEEAYQESGIFPRLDAILKPRLSTGRYGLFNPLEKTQGTSFNVSKAPQQPVLAY